MLVAAAREVGGAQIQNRGTLGGNVANASPAGDTLPVLAAAGARIVLRSHAGTRTVPFDAFYTGYRTSVRKPEELITAIEIPRIDGTQWWRKVGTRRAQAISKIMMAAVRGERRSHRDRLGCANRGAREAGRGRVIERRSHRRGAGGPARGDRSDRRHPLDRGVSSGGCRELARRASGARRDERCSGARVLGCWGAGALCRWRRARRQAIADARHDGSSRGDGAGIAVPRDRSSRAWFPLTARPSRCGWCGRRNPAAC